MSQIDPEVAELARRVRRSGTAGGAPPPFLLSTFGDGTGSVSRMPSASTVSGAGESAKGAARVLADVRRTGGPVDRDFAGRNVHEILRILSDPYRGWTGVRSSGLLAAGSRVEEWSASIHRHIPTLAIGDFFGPWWTAARLLLTGVATMLLAVGQLRLAAVFLIIRIVGSALQPTPGLSSDMISGSSSGVGRRYSADWYIDWRACAVGHFCDTMVLFGISACLMGAGRMIWGAVVGSIAVLQISATLLRVSAVQGGLVLRRLFLERLMRNVPLLIAFVAASSVQTTIPANGFPVIALAGLGAGIYAVGEVVRVIHSSEASRRVDNKSTLDEMVWRRMANLVPVVERSVIADRRSDAIRAMETESWEERWAV
jgi:hypothetical protein